MGRVSVGVGHGHAYEDTERWVADLRARDSDAIARLHALLLRAARFEVGRRRQKLPHLRGGDLDDIAQQAADDAVVAVLRRLETFGRGSRFTTWAYKFALLEAAVKLRQRSWQGREVPVEPEAWTLFAGNGDGPIVDAEHAALLDVIGDGINRALTPRQRDVLVALAVNGVPVDVLAERLDTTRGALYKTLHDARQRLRQHLEAAGWPTLRT